jgi:hippurate hydrolase
VIPDSATLLLNLRWLKPQVRELMLKRIDEIDLGIATAAGVPADRMPARTMKGHAGPPVNDSALVERLRPGLVALLGSKPWENSCARRHS